MHSRCGQDNAQSLFGLTQIPTTPQIRNILDEIAARELFRVFTWIYQELQRGQTILDFGFWILDFGLEERSQENQTLGPTSSSPIQNLKSKI